MKRSLPPFLIAGLILLLAGCSDKPEDVPPVPEPVILVKNWVKAIETLNYEAYKRTEANPMTRAAFMNRYADYYFRDLQINHVIPPDENDFKRGPDGRHFIWSDVRFQCRQVGRESGKVLSLVQGDVRCIRYIRKDEPGKKGPWKMLNRTFLRMPEGIDK